MTSVADAVIWSTMVIAGIGTFAIRLSFIALLGRVERIPPLAERALRLVPAAVLAALVAPGVFRPEGVLDPWNDRLLAAAVAALVAWWTRNVLATLVAGMVVLWLLQLA
jgi:branched-subunit amino acid transport protein